MKLFLFYHIQNALFPITEKAIQNYYKYINNRTLYSTK